MSEITQKTRTRSKGIIETKRNMHRKQEPRGNRGNYLKISSVGVTDITRKRRTGTRKIINEEKKKCNRNREARGNRGNYLKKSSVFVSDRTKKT